MSDLTEWIKERRRIHRGGWRGTWIWSLGELDKATLAATGGHVDFDLIRDDEFRGPSEVLDEIVDAHNVAIPAALTAVEKVLELHTRVVTDQHIDGPTAVCEQCSEDRMFQLWPCETVLSVQSAIEGVSDE